MKLPRRAILVIALFLWIPIGAVFGCLLIYEPLKFTYLIHRIESAKTADEERAAFELAKRWGRVWEVHLWEPPRDWLDYRELDPAVQDPQRTLEIELEWLKSMPSGVPYRAQRTPTTVIKPG